MADRPNSFNTATPAGGDSPRSGDDEIRRVKTYTQNAYNDLTQPPGIGISRTDLYGNTINADTGFTGDLTGNVTGNTIGDHQGTVGATVPNTGSFTTVASSGDVMTTGGNFVGPLMGNVTGNVTGNLTGSVTGNADTASALAESRNISLSGDVTGFASFDGSGNVTIPATIQPNSVALGTDTTGDYVQRIIGAPNEIEVTNGTGEGSTAVLSLPSTITADLNGRADTAVALAIPRTIALSGDVVGSATFDGTQNISINADLQTGATVSGNIESASRWQNARTISLAGDATGSVSINGSQDETLNVTVTGGDVDNADTADTWTTARTVTLSGDATGSVSINGGSNVSLPVTVTGGDADTAATLATARTIGGVSFNGSANINLPGVNAAGNQDTTGNAAGITGVTATNAELNRLDLAAGTQLGIMSLEAVSAGDPVIGDFSGNITIIGQYA